MGNKKKVTLLGLPDEGASSVNYWCYFGTATMTATRVLLVCCMPIKTDSEFPTWREREREQALHHLNWPRFFPNKFLTEVICSQFLAKSDSWYLCGPCQVDQKAGLGLGTKSWCASQQTVSNSGHVKPEREKVQRQTHRKWFRGGDVCMG